MNEPRTIDLSISFMPATITPEAAAQALGASEWGEQMEPEQLLALTRHFRVYHVARGAELCTEGDPGLYMGVLVRGSLRVGKRDFYGNERHFGTVEPGDAFGEMSFLDHQPRSASLKCSEDAEILVLTQGSYMGLVKEDPHLAVTLLEQLCRVLSHRVRRLTDRSVQQLL